MCSTCGCSDSVARGGHEHPHEHGRRVELEERILAKNDCLAQRNRDWFAAHRITAVNLMGSPGAGKTTLLERTVRDSADGDPMGVVEGDQATMFDAERIRAAGCPVVQINTGTGCHLDASMLDGGIARLAPETGATVFVENVGNLVCPALFDLGEAARVVAVSVTEGEDKPLKYPHMFRSADLVVLTKVDLLPHLSFDADRFWDLVVQVDPGSTRLGLSAATGEGMDAWHTWLRVRRAGGLPGAVLEGERHDRAR